MQRNDKTREKSFFYRKNVINQIISQTIYAYIYIYIYIYIERERERERESKFK